MGKTGGNMADKGNGIADGSSSKKRNGDGDDRSGNRKRKHTSHLDDVAVEEVSRCNDDDVSNTYKIKVKMPTGKMRSFKVKGSDTVGSIKVKIQTKKGIPFDQQELILNKFALEDKHTLDILDIKKDSILTLMRKSNGLIKIIIKDPLFTDYLYVKPNETIDNIIGKISGFGSRDVLIFNETVLEESATLADFNVIDGSTLVVIGKLEGYMDIFVNMYTGRLSLSVKPTHTIANVKSYIQDEQEIHPDEQVLIFNNMVLGDLGTLFDFGINRNSTLTLMHRPWEFTRSMRIFIKPLTGETITQEVEPSDTIANIKAKIQDKVYVPCYEQELIFNEIVLSDIDTVADFHVNEGSTLTLMHKPRGFRRFMQIFIKTLNGETITQEVKPSDTIGDIKTKIQDKVDVPRDEQELVFNEVVLSDIDTVADFHINKGATLTLMHKPRGFTRFMQIFIKTLNGETITHEVKPWDPIGYIKTKIQDKVDVPCDEQELIFNEMVLSDIDTIADFHITKESTLTLMRISNGFMRIFINVLSGNTITLDVRPSNTISDIKSKICDKGHLSFNMKNLCFLIFNDKHLEDSATLADYNIPKESTMDLIRVSMIG